MVVKVEKAPRVEKKVVKVTTVRNAQESAGMVIGSCGNCGYGVSFDKGTTTKCDNCNFTVLLEGKITL